MRIDGPVVAGAEHVVVGWPIAIDGRKHHAGGAIFSADGALLAAARALLIAPRDQGADTLGQRPRERSRT